MRSRLCILIRTGIALILFGPSIATACTCLDPGNASQDKVIDAVCEVDVVFVGKTIDQLSAPNENRRVKIDPVVVYKGRVPESLVVEVASTCDHWFLLNESYLVFGDVESGSNRLTTSICGPTQFTDKLGNAQYQLNVVDEHIDRVDELCGEIESSARRMRIAAQDRSDREASEAESLRLLKDGINRSRVEYEEALEAARSAKDEGS